MRKFVAIAAAAVVVVGFATSASAVTITFKETGTGFTSLSFSPGFAGTITLDVVIALAPGEVATGYNMRGVWDESPFPELLTASGTTFTANAGFGFFADVPPGVTLTQSTVATRGLADGWGGANAFGPPTFPYATGVTFTTGTISFTLTGNTGTTVVGSDTFLTIGLGSKITCTSGSTSCIGAGVGSFAISPTAATLVGTTITVIPEPATASLLGLGLIGLIVAGRRRRA